MVAVAELDTIYDGLRATDEAVAKAVGISQVAQIARTESRLREYVLGQWRALAGKAIKQATNMAKQGKPAKSIAAAVRQTMKAWPRTVLPRLNREVDQMYRLAREAGWKKATGQTKASLGYDTPNLTEIVEMKTVRKAIEGFSVNATFDLIDDEAVAALQKQQTFWVGQHYNENLAAAISTTTSETMIEAGRNRAVAGQLMSERLRDQFAHVRTPGGFHGSAEQYFEGLVANAATVARAHGQLSSFMRVGATRYEIVNPRDRRTCPVCAHMDGKTFTVQQGADQMHEELKADSPEAIKESHPWLPLKGVKAISPTAGKASSGDSAALAKAGFAIPPFHFRCRCAVDVDPEGTIDEPISPPTPKKPAAVAAVVAPGDPAARHLLLGNVTKQKPIGVGEFGAEKVTLAHEGKTRQAVMKFADQERRVRDGIEAGTMYRREAAAYQLDAELGGQTVVPRTVARDPGLGLGEASFQDFVAGAKTTPQIESSLGVEFIGDVAQAGAPSARRMVMLDVIMANDDRHHMNVMFKVLKRKGKKDSLRFVAIDNGLTFPDKRIGRFIFPDGEQFGFFADSALALDSTSIKQLARLKMNRLAEILVEAKLPEKAIRGTMIRVKAMQSNSKVVRQLSLGPGRRELSSPEKVMHFVDLSLTKPAELVTAPQFKEIMGAIKKATKTAAGAAP